MALYRLQSLKDNKNQELDLDSLSSQPTTVFDLKLEDTKKKADENALVTTLIFG